MVSRTFTRKGTFMARKSILAELFPARRSVLQIVEATLNRVDGWQHEHWTQKQLDAVCRAYMKMRTHYLLNAHDTTKARQATDRIATLEHHLAQARHENRCFRRSIAEMRIRRSKHGLNPDD
jgi:hypothetical protein